MTMTQLEIEEILLGLKAAVRRMQERGMKVDGTGSSAYFPLPIGLGLNGGIYQGTGTFATPTTGLKIWNDAGIGRIGGYNAGVVQWYANTDGKLYMGGGKVIGDTDGLTFNLDGLAGTDYQNYIKFTVGGVRVAQFYAFHDPAVDTRIGVSVHNEGIKNYLFLNAVSQAAYQATSHLEAYSGTVAEEIRVTANRTADGKTLIELGPYGNGGVIIGNGSIAPDGNDLYVTGDISSAAGTGVETYKMLDGTTTKSSLKWVGDTITWDIPSVEPANKITNGSFDTDLSSWTNLYSLNDEFTADVAAGSVHGSSATPTGTTRTAVDTGSRIAVSGGKLLITGGGGIYTDPLFYEDYAITRAAGRTILMTVIPSSVASRQHYWGVHVNKTGYPNRISFSNISGTTLRFRDSGEVGTITLGATYQLAFVMRTSGGYYLIKGGTEYPAWTLVWFDPTYGEATNYVGALNFTNAASYVNSVDNIRIPTATWLPVPKASDGFSSTTTDGKGHTEENGGSGLSWTDIGTWGVAAGILSCSSLSGGLGIRYLNGVSSNAIIDVDVTRAGGNAGLVARYVDADNYIYAYHDGTNAVCVKRVAGVETTLRTGVVAYAAGAVLRLVFESATRARLFYNNLAVGGVFTVPTSTSTNHGVYTTNTGNSFDDFVVFDRSGSYTALDDEIARDTLIKYAGAASVKIIAGSDRTFLFSANVGDTSTYTLTCYAYTTGAAVVTADLDLWYDGAELTTTFADMGSGWYKLTGTLTGVASAKDYGVRVHAGKTAYVDSFTLQAGAGNNTILSILNSGTGIVHQNVEGTTTLNAGIATEQALIVKGFAGQTANLAEFQQSDGTIKVSIDENGITAIGAALVAASANDGLLQVTGVAGQAYPAISAYNDTAGGGIVSYNSLAEGTTSGGRLKAGALFIPSATGKLLGSLRFGAYRTGTTFTDGATIEAHSAEAWSNTAVGSYIKFMVATNASTTRAEVLRLGDGAKIGFFGATPVIQQAHIPNPTGGAVVDTEARAAIVLLTALMETYGFTALS
jgi:hypothetical protein